MRKTATILMFYLFTALGRTCAQAPTLPTLPQQTVSLTLPMQGTSTCPTLTTGSNCIRNVPSGDAPSFQNAINAATCGDTIVLAAGSTYSGNFTIPSTSCSGWIVITSSALTSLPATGTRVSISNLSTMATVSTPNANPAIRFNPSSNHWRLIGLDITTSYVTTTLDIYYIVGMGDSETNQSLLPSYIIFDRDLILGLSNTNTTHGIGMNGASIGIVDSYCDEIHDNQADSQCFISTNGTGPFLIQNNYIRAAGENIMFGGATPYITNLIPSDITIVGNLFDKNLTWRGQAAPYNWVIKNLFELKNAQRLLLDGNVLQNCWQAGQAFSVLIRSAQSTCSWCVVQDVTVTHNRIQHVQSGIQVAPPDPSYTGMLDTSRVLISNNLLVDVSAANWGPGALGRAFEISSNTTHGIHNITMDHNTAFSDTTFLYLGDQGRVDNAQITNMIGDYASYGIFGAGVGSGTAALTTFLSPYIYDKTVLLNATGTNMSGYTYPTPQTSFSTLATVGFTSYSGKDPTLSGGFQLTGGSPYHNAGTDGKDIGVWDWTCLNNDSTTALAGNFVPSVGGCAFSGNNLPPLPPTNLTVLVQ